MTQISKTFIFILTIFQWTFGTVIQIKLPDGKELTIKIPKKQQPKPDFTRIYNVWNMDSLLQRLAKEFVEVDDHLDLSNKAANIPINLVSPQNTNTPVKTHQSVRR